MQEKSLGVMTQEEFEKSIIAQDDDNDYDESGYVAVIKDGQAAIANYGHCSCYGTFESLCEGGVGDYFEQGNPKFMWIGTVEELIFLALAGMDPAMPDRKSNPDDFDYDHLCEVYKQIADWATKRENLEPLVRNLGEKAIKFLEYCRFNRTTLLVIAGYYDENGIDMAWLRLVVEKIEVTA